MAAGEGAGGDCFEPGCGLFSPAGGFSNWGLTSAGAGDGWLVGLGCVGGRAGGCWPVGRGLVGAVDGVTGMPLQIFSSYLNATATW